MTDNLKNRILSITKKLRDIPKGKNKHFTFLIRRNKIVSMGWNDSYSTHPMSHKYGYRFDSIHSEISAIIRYRGDDMHKCTLINTRVNLDGRIGMSMPCEICTKVINQIGIKKIWYTNHEGQFIQLI